MKRSRDVTINRRDMLRKALLSGWAASTAVLMEGCSDTNSKSGASTSKMSVDALSTYRGADRQHILTDQAKDEGKLVVYNSNNAIIAAAKEFGKRFPFIEVDTLLQNGSETQARLQAEVSSGKIQVDVFGGNNQPMSILADKGYFREFWSPALDGTVYVKGPSGLALYVDERYSYGGLGYNTELVKDPPRSMQDMLDPQWVGKIAVTVSDTTVDWIGAILYALNEDYLAELAKQKLSLQSVAASALTDLVGAGQFAMYPVSAIADVVRLKAAGAPIAWVPLDASVSRRGSSALIKNPPHPAAALTFLDWLMGPEGQTFVTSQGYISPRSDVKQPDIGNVDLKELEKKAFPIDQLSAQQYEADNAHWRDLFHKYFVQG